MVLPARALLLVLVFQGCSIDRLRPAPAEPSGPEQAALVFAAAPTASRFGWPPPVEAEFLRVVGGKPAEEGLLRSNHASRGNLYLLDVLPGRYAPVSVTWRRMGRDRVFRFTLAQALKAAVEARPGEVVFLGRLRPDPWKTVAEGSGMAVLVDRSSETERAVLQTALADLGRMLWRQPLEARLGSLGPVAAPPAAAVGPGAVQARGFSYKDVLQWGPPVKLASGLEWREKLGRARIAAQYISAKDEGYLPLGEELSKLKTAGTPEDDRLVRETVTFGLPSYTARYGTFYYPPGYLLGSAVEAYVTESVLIPGKRGLWKLHYRAQKKHFDRFLPAFQNQARHIFPQED